MPQKGPLRLQKLLAMASLRPIIFSEKYRRCPQKGPLHSQELLKMASLGPIIFSEKCRRCPQMGPFHLKRLPTMASPGPIIVFGCVADFLRRAYCILLYLG